MTVTDLLTIAFILSLVALGGTLIPRWRDAPATTLWCGLQLLRSMIWFTRDFRLITHLAMLFPVIQVQIVMEAILASRADPRDKRRWPYYLWCLLIGEALALFALALNPEPYPLLSKAVYDWHLGMHLLMLGALVASVAYTALVMRSVEPRSLVTRCALILYFGASVAADALHDPALWTVSTDTATVIQTFAVLALAAAYGLFRPEHPASTRFPGAIAPGP